MSWRQLGESGVVALARQAHLGCWQFQDFPASGNEYWLLAAVHGDEDLVVNALGGAVWAESFFVLENLALAMILMTVGAAEELALGAKQATGGTAVVSQQPFLVHSTENDVGNPGAWSSHGNVVCIDFVAATDQTLVNRVDCGAVERLRRGLSGSHRHVKLRFHLAQANRLCVGLKK